MAIQAQLYQLTTQAEGIDMLSKKNQVSVKHVRKKNALATPSSPQGHAINKKTWTSLHRCMWPNADERKSVTDHLCGRLLTPLFFLLYETQIGNLQEFKAAVKKETGMKIKALRSDRGGEYMHVRWILGIPTEAWDKSWDYSRILTRVAEMSNRTLSKAASLAGPDGFRLQETVWSQLQG